MKYWLRGKRGGLVGFLMIAGLVLGGLGWVTAAVLRLEDEQRRAHFEAERNSKVRKTLWQLDSLLLLDLNGEYVRPYYQLGSLPARHARPDANSARAEEPAWILLHFEVDQHGWRSPELSLQASRAEKPPDADRQRRRTQVLAELQGHWTAPQLLAVARDRDVQPQDFDNTMVMANNALSGPQKLGNDYEKRQAYNIQTQVQQESQSPAVRSRVSVRLSRQMVPVWLSRPGQPEQLVLLRRVELGGRPMCYGVVIDWPRLRGLLAEQVRDEFADARFVPVRTKVPAHPDSTLAALPIELVPGPTAAGLSPAGWTPLRIGLGIAWAAVLVALLAVGLGGWSILDLSERRSRFVSAVTHELRTPLTTLRLYLDMLTSGMVSDEQRKAEYLQTLHAEADRLNRLIGNVLDFSRLENQRPRLEKKPVPVADLLEQLRATWQVRCQDAGKELVVENQAGVDALLVTDEHLVQQILGNLVDNACKYSRGAEDAHIWVRASVANRQVVLEVEDRGPGIAARERRAVFSPFRRGRDADVTAGGVGLGLALARRWAQLLGGQLSLQTTPETSGACFRLEIAMVGV